MKKKFLKNKKVKDLKYKIVFRYVHKTTYNHPIVINLLKKDMFEKIACDKCKE